MILLDGHQKALECLLGTTQMQHGNAQIIHYLTGAGRAHGLQCALAQIGRQLLIEAQRILKELGRNCIVTHAQMNDAHVVGNAGAQLRSDGAGRAGEGGEGLAAGTQGTKVAPTTYPAWVHSLLMRINCLAAIWKSFMM